ncbi:MAG: Maf family protein [Candidatus Binataceae bacterium]
MTGDHTIILASGSPRRKELLAKAGIAFEAIESGVNEASAIGESACEYAIRTARDKALAVSARFPQRLVLAADTVVECEGTIMGKPSDRRAARTMLQMLAARTHRVTTSFALACGGAVVESDAVTSSVTFRALGSDEIEAYLASGDSLDKAGAYGIQGIGGTFITRVEGPRDNVMGLPVDAVLAALRRWRAFE